MRSSSYHTLLLLLLVSLLLNCTGNSEQLAVNSDQFTSIETPDVVSEEVKPSKTINHADEIADKATLNADSAFILAKEPEVGGPAHLSLAESYVGTQELTGQNDGPEIERFLASVGLRAGNPYCAAFISFVLDETPDIKAPTVRSGLASHFITDQSIDARHVLRGAVEIDPGTILIWRKGNTIYGHAGFVAEQTDVNQFETIEANTGSGVYGDQSDGDGVWQRQRSIQPGNYFRITDFTPVVYNS